ncbi:cell adhesion molecule CEACAM1-like, partial [Chaetodon trifascialis]|uniref:cell adhesion molecule CEACAM1-like n=1 Tax=Chaetodon trifascialis TaxID=109706 RepID=UPI0039959A51
CCMSVIVCLFSSDLIQSADVPQQTSLAVAELGGNVTLQFQASDDNAEFFHLYKQSLGYLVQSVVAEYYGKRTISEAFRDSRFTVIKKDSQYFFTIRNVSREDEATYLFQNGSVYSQSFSSGVFLAVNDRNQQKSVNVKQSPETALIKPGGSVTLNCSLLSKNKDNRVQCPGEHSVYWFRPGSGKSHPAIIYTHRNRSYEQNGRSCLYSLSQTVRDSSDTGTYYCAVATCGQILFGEGTQVQTRIVWDSGPEVDPVVLVLGALLACCVTVIVVFIFYVNRRKVCDQCKGAVSASHHVGHDKSTADQSNDQDGEAQSENYAALNLSARKVKRVTKRSESPQECVYSVVRADHHSQQHPSLQAEHSL